MTDAAREALPLLDVIMGYDCNLACDYCTITPAMRARALPAPAIDRELQQGRREGYARVSFTGGEPTIRPELVALVRRARALGYAAIKVQSNGLAFAHAPNLARLIEAGCDEIHVSIHTHDAAAYDRMVRRDGAYPAMVTGLRHAVAAAIPVTVDVILTTATVPRLVDAIGWLADLGVRRVDLWFVSLTDGNAANVASMPRMTEVLPQIRAAVALATDRAMRVRSLHVPRCLLGELHAHAFDPGAGRVKVVTPEATFALAMSKLAGQVHVPACASCAHRTICPGVRADYVARYGDGEIAAARGQAATMTGAIATRLPIAP